MSLHHKPDRLNFDLENEESYKDLFDNAHDLVHFADVDGTLIYVNRSWMNTLGYAIEEIQGKSIFLFLEDEYKSSFHQYRNAILNHEKEPETTIICVRTKHGNKLFLEGSVTVKRKEGKAMYTRGIFRDITSKLENEKQLRQYNQTLLQREAALQQLLNNAPDAVIVIDTNSSILFWNPKAEDIFGWKSEEVLHTNLSGKIIPPAHRAAHDAGMKRFLSTGEAHVLNRTVEITALNKSGAEFYISLTISTTMQKEATAFIAFIRDISEQKKNELELENKRKELEETNKELEQFAFAASHDMQEPLRKIQTFASMLTEHDANGISVQGKEYLSKIAAAAQRMKLLIDALLNYSYQTQNGRDTVATDLNQILKTVVSDLELMIHQKNAIVTIDDLPVIQAMPVQMEQLFYNLLNNALKFSRPDAAPEVHIGYHRISGTGNRDMFEIFVKDNGIGFDQQNANKIFGLFQRLNDRYSYEGTGIGLTLCKKIVSLHDGEITASSFPGKGTTFYIQLPADTNRK